MAENLEAYMDATDALRALMATHQPAALPAAAPPPGGGGAAAAQHQNRVDRGVLSTLKPQPLGPDESYTNFVNWKEKFTTYFRLTNINTFQIQDQQIALFGCLDKELRKKVRMNLKDDTPVAR